MARLNEPLMAPDSIETLRRKFLRQNRDIARINSTQSLRIRGLENECARMLSENLDLRGQILRLETELQESRAQRIADHAMEIKEKMEAQLLEWGSMLASLGHEPIPKNRSPRVSKKAKTRTSLSRSPPQWRRRNTSEVEAAALQEGRLPPLWENKPCPRDTMNRAEILALCSEAAETTDSPDLGPPPVSRFVDEDPVKLDLPTKSLSAAPGTSKVEESLSKPLVKETLQPTPSITKEEESPRIENPTVKKIEPKPTKTTPTPDSQTALQLAKSNLKRKMREDDDKENGKDTKSEGTTAKLAKGQPENLSRLVGRPINRIIKDPASLRREAREKGTTTTPSVAPRKPLSSRNANVVVNSPKKSSKPSTVDEIAKAKAEAKAEAKDHKGLPKDAAKPKKRADALAPIEIPAPEPEMPAPVATIELEPETFSAEPNLSAPDSPEPSAPWEEMRDTPPPTDISSRGETSRGSRRARTAVSYAEPNLRDKMRRPTKQLFDAVAGEGKSMRRTSHSKATDLPSIKSEEKSQGWKDLPAAAEVASDNTASPLAQKTSRASPSEDIPIAVALQRKKRSSSVETWVADAEGVEQSKLASKPTNRRLEEIAAREIEVARIFDKPDVYEFTISSPSNGSKETTTVEGKSSSSSSHLGSRRQTSAVREDIGQDADGEDNQARKARGRPRKRASMMVQKTSTIEAENSAGRGSPAEGDSLNSSSSPAEAEGLSARDRAAMRRKSMML